jgi:hypothetical protein
VTESLCQYHHGMNSEDVKSVGSGGGRYVRAMSFGSGGNSSSLATLRRFVAWENENTLLPFTSPSFNEAEYIQQAVGLNSTGTKLAALNKLIEEIGHEIRKQVVHHHEDLLSQTTKIVEVEKRLATAAMRIQSLKHGIKRIRLSLVNPVREIEGLVRQLESMNTAAHLARHCIRYQSLTKQLSAALAPPADGQQPSLRDLAKAATCCSQILTIEVETDVKGLTVVDKHAELVASSRQLVVKLASAALNKGVETMNQADMGGALHVFFNLGTEVLVQRVHQVVSAFVSESVLAAKTSLDVTQSSSPSRARKSPSKQPSVNGSEHHAPSSTHPSSSSSSSVLESKALPSTLPMRMAVWENLSDLSDKLFGIALQLRALDDTLTAKQEASMSASFGDIVSVYASSSANAHIDAHQQLTHTHTTQRLPERFWASFTASLKVELQAVFEKKKKTKLVGLLVVQYPKLLTIFRTMYVVYTYVCVCIGYKFVRCEQS